MSKILVSVKNMPKACVLLKYVVRKMQKKNKNTKIQTKSMYYRKKTFISKTVFHNCIQGPKQEHGSTGFVYKLYLIKVSHPYLYYPSLFKEGFSPVIEMRFSIHVSISFQLRHLKFCWRTSHRYSNLSLTATLYLTSLDRTYHLTVHICLFGTDCLRKVKLTCR